MSREVLTVTLKDGKWRVYNAKGRCIAADPLKFLAKEKARHWLNKWTDRGYKFEEA